MKWVLLFVLLLVPFSYGLEDKMSILAVSQLEDGNMSGSVATLSLEIIPGKGRVFIDTYPLTKVDTQISTRIGKQIACDFLQVDCSEFDFIYTIKSGSSIIGGPSAGAAMTLLTIGMLDGESLIDDVSMSGTINSGGLIGSVGGLKEKIEAARRYGIKKVLIPQGERNFTDPLHTTIVVNQTNATVNNNTIDLVEYGQRLGVTVVEVGNMFEALPHIIKKEYVYETGNISIPPFYSDTMGMLAEELCERSDSLLETLDVQNVQNKNTAFYIDKDGIDAIGKDLVLEGSNIDVNQTYNNAVGLQNSSVFAREHEQYYAAASYCYGASLNLQFLHKFTKNVSVVRDEVELAFAELDLNLDNYQTITDLQTYMLVEERISEAEDFFSRGDELRLEGKDYDAINQYVVALERIASAEAWSNFAKGFGSRYDFSGTDLIDSCELRIREAEERFNYLTLYVPTLTVNEGLLTAKKHQRNGEYELCLHQASITKADIDVILASSGVGDNEIEEHVAGKMKVAEQLILRQIQKGNFPIIGYSYLEYAKSLAVTDARSSVLYLQYAIELSNLDLYFPEKRTVILTPEKRMEFFFLIGFVSCFVLVGVVHGLFKIHGHKKRNTKHKTKKRARRKR